MDRVARTGWSLRCSIAALALCLAPLAAAPAGAHDTSFSYMDLDWQRTYVALRVSVHRDDAAVALGVATPESLTSAAFLPHEAARLAAVVAAGLQVQADGRAVPLAFAQASAVPAKRSIALRFVGRLEHPAGRLRVAARLFPASPQHETFLNVYAGGRLLRQSVLTRTEPASELYGQGPAGVLAVVATFVRAGMHHIFIGPDHILFVVGLLLLGGGLGRVLKVATAFTLAHSLTLALAATGHLDIPARVVEPLIALSIVYVGIENLRSGPSARDRRALLAFTFGLVHGLGFAGVLREFGLPGEALGWSLVSFNLGVELGQACIILAVTPLLGVLRAARPRIALRAVAAGSWGIIVAGGYWFVQRLLVHV
jgi:hydrogenase/urease accessory protein HupE